MHNGDGSPSNDDPRRPTEKPQRGPAALCFRHVTIHRIRLSRIAKFAIRLIAIAFVLSSHLGADTGDHSRGHLPLYCSQPPPFDRIKDSTCSCGALTVRFGSNGLINGKRCSQRGRTAEFCFGNILRVFIGKPDVDLFYAGIYDNGGTVYARKALTLQLLAPAILFFANTDCH
jgi:hypothetical protein